MTRWRTATTNERTAAVTRLGGQPSWSATPRWPLFDGEPLPFLGQIRVDQGLILLFLSLNPDSMSWEPEDGGNAAFIEPDGEFPSWTTPADRDKGPVLLPEILVPDDSLVIGGEPDWIQQDETPAAATQFVCTLRGMPDLLGHLEIGDAGNAYVFLSSTGHRARILWQS
jgi:hypothetical protein